MYKYTRAKNYNYQIPGEESQIHGSRCNTLKHGETISQNKHCHDFWWLLLTVWIGKQQHKSNSLDLPFIYRIPQKSTHMIINQNVSYGKYSWSSIQKGKQHVTLQRILSRRKLSPRQHFATIFLKKGSLETFPAPSTERRCITQSKRENIVNKIGTQRCTTIDTFFLE